MDFVPCNKTVQVKGMTRLSRCVSYPSIRRSRKETLLCLIGLSRATVRDPSQVDKFFKFFRSDADCMVDSALSSFLTLTYVSLRTSFHKDLSPRRFRMSR